MRRGLHGVAASVIVIASVACGEDAPSGRDADTTAPDTAGDVAGPDAPPPDAPETSETDASPVDVAAPACTIDLDCRLPCVEGRCVEGRCVHGGPDPTATGCAIGEPPTCVAAGAPSPERACFFCNPHEDSVGFVPRALGEGFEVGAGRLLVEKLTPSSASWTISTARAATGGRSLYFGDPTRRSYDTGERAAARALTPPLAVPDDGAGLALTLTFSLFADTEETPGFDRLRVLRLPPEGEGPEEELWSSDAIGGTTRGEFLPIALALGAVRAGTVIAFEVDTIDGIINGFEGFYLDDVAITSGCCDAAHPCDDGNACTDDACAAGTCTFTSRASCCLADVDCDDGDPCSDDLCVTAAGASGGTCASTPRLDCCAVAADCDDEDPCTADACTLDTSGAGRCGHAPLCCAGDADCDDGDACTIGACLDGQCRYRSACCRADADCDDGLACTIDLCNAGVCSNELTYEPGCCIPDVLTERFDGGTPAGWTLSPATNNVGWRVQPNATAPSGTAVLYYGHPTLTFYESGGRNTGTATSRPLRLPDGVELGLSFKILLDIEDNAQRDLFRVEALVGQTTVVLVDKAELQRGAWQDVAVDLSWAASQLVQIRFFFDTVDGAQNTTRGIFIDDVRLLSSCLPRRCGISSECGSRASCIEGACEEGVCRYGGGC